MTYHVQFLLLVRQPLFDRAALPLTQTSWVLPPLSVGEMTLRLYGALNYSHGFSKGPSFGTGRDLFCDQTKTFFRQPLVDCREVVFKKLVQLGQVPIELPMKVAQRPRSEPGSEHRPPPARAQTARQAGR